MSYFDHVQCPECNASFKPEAVESRGGNMACPKCGAGLQLKNLFGLNSAFAEEENPNLELDDLIPEGDRNVTWFGHDEYGRFPGQEPPQPKKRRAAPEAAAATPSARGAMKAITQRSSPPATGNENLPSRVAGRDYVDGGSGASAMDVLRGIKKKK